MFLLPIDATIVAKHADQRSIGGRFSLTGVQVEFFDHAEKPTRFRVSATDTKQLVAITGDCPKMAEYPTTTMPGLDACPNGKTSSVIEADELLEAATEAKKLSKKAPKEMRNLLVVRPSETVTTLAASNGEQGTCQHVTNVECWFLLVDDVLRIPPYERTVRFAVDPKLLAKLMTTAGRFVDDDSLRVDFTVRLDDKGEFAGKPIHMTATRADGLELNMILMPLR